MFLTVDGGWSSWTNWTLCFTKCYRSPCSEMCGAQRIRQRFCNTPIPWQGGNYCFGNSRQQEACNTSYTTSSLIGEVLHILESIKGIKTEELKPIIVHGLKYCIYNCYKPFIAKLTWHLLVLFRSCYRRATI